MRLVIRVSAKLFGKKAHAMKRTAKSKFVISLALLLGTGMVSSVSAGTGDLGIGKTTLGTVIVDGKGMTAYYYLPDVPNSGVSSCTGGCLVHWPAITSKTATPVVDGVTAKVSVIPGSNQILINGRPIYTFAGDQSVGQTNGQGIGGVWYVISPAGVELNATELAKESAKPSASPSPTPTITHKATPKPKVKVTKKPKPKKSTAHSYYGR
jgi:predicted lipoprotein with Yx(FWY)xxD motif